MFKAAAAGHFHAHDGKALDGVLAQDLGQLLRVIHGVQLGTTDKGDPPADEILMEACVGVSGTVRGDEKMSLVKKRAR